MYRVDVYLSVRQACLVDGKSQRQASREFNINRRSISKMLKHPVPPGYKRIKEVKSPKLEPHKEFIAEILETDRSVHRKQRHTAKRIFKRLKEEKGYEGGYTIVREYVFLQKQERGREVYIPLTHAPGEAQVDFGEAYAIIEGLKQKVHLFVLDMAQSDGGFVKAYIRENTESFLDGHVSAFNFFGGVPLKIVYDNTTIAVSKILGGEKRKRTRAFCELQSHYLFKDIFARPSKGNDKGKVEGLVGYSRRNFMVPLPEFESMEAFNKYLEACCIERQKDILRGHKESIGQRLERDEAVLRPLPDHAYEACSCVSARVSSQSLVRYQNNDYSVPVRYGYKDVFVKGYVDEVVIIHKDKIIARHKRCYEREESIYNPLHYLAALEYKVRAFDQAAPLKGWSLPPEFIKVEKILEDREGKKGKREYIRILRLLETHGLDDVEKGLQAALRLGTLRVDAIKHLILCHMEERPANLNLLDFPKVPKVNVHTTSANDYAALIG